MYTFLINYIKKPVYSGIVITRELISLDSAMLPGPALLSDGRISYDRLIQFCNTALSAANNQNIKTKRYRVSLRVKGIYVHDDLMFLKMQLRNESDINYDVELFRLVVRDKLKTKRTAIQETEVKPLLISGPAKRIAGRRREHLVIALPKFTIPDKKWLTIQIMEHEGGRHLSLKVAGKRIIRAAPLIIKN